MYCKWSHRDSEMDIVGLSVNTWVVGEIQEAGLEAVVAAR